jgi:peroxiredoxin
MKKILSLTVLLLSLFIFSCKNKDAFTISGTVENPGSLKKVYLYQADSTTVSLVDSTNLSEQGKFQFKRSAAYPNMYKLRIGGSEFDMIAKNGDGIEFNTNNTDSLHMYQISGSDESEKIKEFNTISNKYILKAGKVYEEYQAKAEELNAEPDSLLKKKKAEELIATYRPMIFKINDAKSAEILAFVNQNKTSLAGFYAITSLDPQKYERELIAYAEAIKNDFKDNAWVQRFIKHMMVVKPVSVGQKAPDFTVRGIDGKEVKLSDYKGKYVMLDFWASWCAPCREENPNVVKLYAVYHPKGLNILGISLDVDKSLWQKAIDKDKLTWSHASDLKNFEGPVEMLYRVEAIPANFVIDPNGIIIAKSVFGADLAAFLKKTFSKTQ